MGTWSFVPASSGPCFPLRQHDDLIVMNFYLKTSHKHFLSKSSCLLIFTLRAQTVCAQWLKYGQPNSLFSAKFCLAQILDIKVVPICYAKS